MSTFFVLIWACAEATTDDMPAKHKANMMKRMNLFI